MSQFWQYTISKLKQLQGTPHSIALGCAFGAAISFTPFIGFHTFLSCLLTWIFNGNILAATIGTLIGNPWTFPFIWIAVYYTGQYLISGNITAINHTDFYELFKSSTHALLSFDFSNFSSDIWPIFYPMLIGCIPFSIAVWIISYYTIKHTLNTLTNNRNKK